MRISDWSSDVCSSDLLTIFLGITFTCVQAYEYSHAAFGFKDGIYPSTFYMATGFHGFHVLVGTIFLIVCFFRGYAGHFKPDHHFGFAAAAWSWPFVEIARVSCREEVFRYV